MTSTRLLFISCAMVAAAAAAAAQSQAPARDARVAAVAPKGTAEVTVTVLTADQPGEPLRRAMVAMQMGELDVPYVGITDDDGHVVFRDLAAGNYLLTASKPGYVKTYYGSPQPGRGPGVAVTVLDGQHVTGIRMRVLRGSVITGVLRNAAGRPAPNQSVRAIPVRSVGGEKQAVNTSETTGVFNMDGQNALAMVSTDDRGQYRIFGLAPGEYLVSVPAIGVSTEEVRQMTAAELDWADKAVAAGSVAGGEAVAAPPPAGGPTVAYSPVYYPGTAVPADATVITLGPEEERAGVDFVLQLVPTAQVEGRVTDASGRPQASILVSLRPTRPDGLDLFASLMNGSGRTAPDGTFTIRAVKPGQYTLSARATVREPGAAPPDTTEARQQVMASILGGGSTGLTHWASEDVIVQGRDITDVTLTLRPGATVTGKIVYDATTKTPPADLSKTQVALSSATGDGGGPVELLSSLTGGGNIGAAVSPDGTFAMSGVPPGRYRLTTQQGLIQLPVANLAVGGWTLKSAMVGGRDIVDSPIEIKSGGDVAGVTVTFTDHPAELSGAVYDPAGRLTPNFPIVVFSTDRGYWTPSSRRVVTARPSSDGKFKVTLPAGEYYVCAVTAVSRTEVYDPSFLDALVPVAFKITIADGEKKTQDLRLGGGLH